MRKFPNYILKGGYALFIFALCISCKTDEPEDPDVEVSTEITVVTKKVTRTGIRSFQSGGTITVTGAEVSITGRGVCWGTEPNPTVDKSKVSNGSGTGTFTSDLTSVPLNANFYLRAYAIGPDGPLYGEQVEFTSAITSELSSETSSASEIILEGIISEELKPITKFSGICWDTISQPGVVADKNLPLGDGEFKVLISDLTPNTRYYFRTFLILSEDTIFSLEDTAVTFPRIIADVAEGISAGAEHATGYCTWDGSNGPEIISTLGLCYSTSELPTIEDDSVHSYVVDNKVPIVIRSLEPNTTYYLRAFAVSEAGVSYSDQTSFTTPAKLKVFYTMNMTDYPTWDQLDAYMRITKSMNTAVGYYDQYTGYNKHVWTNYVPWVQTADATFGGWMRFGSNRPYMNVRTCLHEIAHTMGIGTSGSFNDIMVDNAWTGTNGDAKVKELSGNPSEYIHRYGDHIGPFGLNYDSEGTSDTDFQNHCKLLEAMRLDGLGSY